MCGICGFTGQRDDRTLDAMLAAIVHRGPDAQGTFVNERVSLGNRRLSIIDLSGGDQPIFNETGEIAVVYNGEIYNYRELREELIAAGHRFTTHTDTEILVHLYEELGDQLATPLNGMFAFALWDSRRQRLLLVRDQVGIKPLCYRWDGRTLVFGSEIKSILKHPGVTARRDPQSTHLLLNLRYVPGPRTLFEGIEKLPPGHLLRCELRDTPSISVERWWNWDQAPDTTTSAADWAEQFRTELERAVTRQLVSDVPVGAFLSGGLDSSALVAFASRHTTNKLKTFSLGFNEPTDELEDAKRIADIFATEHTARTLAPDPLSVFPQVVYHVEEPKVNAIQGFYVARMAAEFVKVALSGLGGDELHVGYDLHRYLHRLDRLRNLWPGPLSRTARPLLMSGRRLFDAVGGLAAENYRRGIEMIANLHDSATCYATLRNAWDFDRFALDKIYQPAFAASISVRSRDVLAPYFGDDRSLVEQGLWAELNLKMVDDLLMNEDRVSMANSLEVRVPYLDREIIRQALRMPLAVRFAGGDAKHLMKSAVAPLLPPATLQKRKWGFTFNPYYQFRKDLRDVAARVLTADNLDRQGVFRPDFIRGILEHPPTPKMRWHYFMLWLAVGLHYWHELFLEGRDYRELQESISPSATNR